MPDTGMARVAGATCRRPALVFVLLALVVTFPAAATVPSDSTDSWARRLDEVEDLLFDGYYPLADQQARTLLAEAERNYGADSLEVATVLDLLVRIHGEGSTGTLVEMRALAERAVRIHELRLGAKDARLAESIRLLATVLLGSNELVAARSNLRTALQMQQEILGPDDPRVADTLDDLGTVLMLQSDLDAASEPIQRALEIRTARLGPDHTDVAQSLMSLGCLQLYRGRYQDAQRSFERALEIRELRWRPDHPKIAGTAHNLAILLQTLGDVRGARSLYERALEIRSLSQPPDSPRLALLHVAAADLAQTQGDLRGAIDHYQRALELQDDYLPPDHGDRAATLTGLAHSLQAVGDHQDAMKLLERALEIRRAAGQEADVASSLSRIGLLQLKLNETRLARHYLEQALAIYESLSSPKPLDLAVALLGLAFALPIDQTDESDRLLARSLDIFDEVYGANTPDFAYVLANLAEYRYARGEMAQAVETFDRALTITAPLSDIEHPFVARLLHGQARALAGLGQTAEALDVALDSVAIGSAHLDLTTRALPERQALAYASVSNETLDIVFTLMGLMDETSAEKRRAAWGALIRVRGAVLDEMTTRHRYLLHAPDPVVAELARSLQATRRELANLSVRREEGVSAGLRAKLIKELRKQEEEQQRDLAGYSAEFRWQRARAGLEFEDVAGRLPRGWALVAYARFNRYDPLQPERHSVPSYVAFVLGADRATPAFVTLGAASRLEAAVAAWKAEAAEGYLTRPGSPAAAEAAYLEVGAELRKKIWDPVAPHVVGAQRILIVPDGSLHLVNFAALPTAAGRYLLDSDPAIHLLTVEGDVVPWDAEVPTGRGLLALGGADFNAESLFAALRPDEGAPATDREADGGALIARANSDIAVEPYRGPRAACSDLSSIVFSDLPASEREVEDVAALWTTRAGRAATPPLVLTGAAASESALKRLAPGRRVVHIATHGFFLGQECARWDESLRAIGGLVADLEESEFEVDEERTLLLSGMALAGANHRNLAAPDEDDGILTAEEIATLPLEGVEWIVLSACDTGVGPVQAGEGVFGLRRAVRIAGARTLIISLWQVEDEATREWMTALYDGRLNHGMDATEAVRHASRMVLDRRRVEGLSTHPLFWGGLVATGDWR